MYIDTHAHLMDTRFDGDRDNVMLRAAAQGVRAIIEISCEPDHWQTAIAFAETHPSISVVLGVHPQDARLSSDSVLKRLEDLARHPKVAGIGETGLDYHYENSPRSVQKDVFLKTLDIALRAGKPVVIHCREAYADLIELLSPPRVLPPGVIHCFSGTPSEAGQLAGMGFYIGIDGPVTYPKAHGLKDVVRATVLEKLVLETDSPYLPPQGYRGQRNEPAYLPLIAQEIAGIKGIPVEEVARVTGDNAAALFKLILC